MDRGIFSWIFADHQSTWHILSLKKTLNFEKTLSSIRPLSFWDIQLYDFFILLCIFLRIFLIFKLNMSYLKFKEGFKPIVKNNYGWKSNINSCFYTIYQTVNLLHNYEFLLKIKDYFIFVFDVGTEAKQLRISIRDSRWSPFLPLKSTMELLWKVLVTNYCSKNSILKPSKAIKTVVLVTIKKNLFK